MSRTFVERVDPDAARTLVDLLSRTSRNNAATQAILDRLSAARPGNGVEASLQNADAAGEVGGEFGGAAQVVGYQKHLLKRQLLGVDQDVDSGFALQGRQNSLRRFVVHGVLRLWRAISARVRGPRP